MTQGRTWVETDAAGNRVIREEVNLAPSFIEGWQREMRHALNPSGVLWISVPMVPIAKQRARTYRRKDGAVGSYTPAGTVRAEQRIREAWLEHYGRTAESWGSEAGLRLTVIAYVERPPSAPKKRKLPIVRPDGDNYLKLVQDALNKWAYRDDSILTHIDAKKRYTPSPPTLHGGPGIIISLEEDTDDLST